MAKNQLDLYDVDFSMALVIRPYDHLHIDVYKNRHLQMGNFHDHV